MKRLYIFDRKLQAADFRGFLELRDILKVIAPLVPDTHWQIGDFFEEDGTDWFEFANDDWSQRMFAQEGTRMPTHEFVAMAQTMPQAIWASFSGFRPVDATAPWIMLNAVDSSLWRIDTDAPERRRVARTGFIDVRTQEQ